MQLTALLRTTAYRVYHDQGDSDAKDSTVGDRVHGRPDQLLRPVLYPDAQHRTRMSSRRCNARRWAFASSSTTRASRCCASWPTGCGITALNEFNDVVPLLFSHTAFKSYPAALDRQEAIRPDDQVAGQADQLRLVPRRHQRLQRDRRMDRPTRRADSAGGDHLQRHHRHACRSFPKTSAAPKKAWCSGRSACSRLSVRSPPSKELNPSVEVVWPNFANGKLGHLRIANMIKRGFTGGDESKFHPLYPGSRSTPI